MQFRLDDLLIDIDRERVSRAGEALSVNGLSFRLLAYMLQHGDRVLTFDQLIEGVWAPSVVGEETVTQRIKLLRQALDDSAAEPRYIKSVRGRGYQLGFAPRPVTTPVTEASPGEKPVVPSRAMWISLLIMLLAGGLWMQHAWLADEPGEAATEASVDPRLERAEYYAGIGQRENNERAIALFEEVLAGDPTNPRVRIGLSATYSARVCRYSFDETWAEGARELARSVLDELPEEARAWQALGYANDCLGRIAPAITAYQRAIALDPSNTGAASALAYLMGETGRLAEALALNLRIREQDPAQTFTNLQLARNYELLGYVAAAETLYGESFSLYPDNVFSNAAFPASLYRQGRFSDARQVLAAAMKRPQHPALQVLAGELALLEGSDAEAARAFDAALAMRDDDYLRVLATLHGSAMESTEALVGRLEGSADAPPGWISLALLRQHAGDPVAALAAMNRAVETGFRDRAWLQVSPLFSEMRGQPGFAALIDRISQAVKEQRELVPPADRPTVPSG
ncbi:MAG: winged helix-turn-helix domain-containing protein [Gammaproteobacteria bacterium]|nr:winged helix-turn-helix domain-containing protein [Gammaproteobacteria bacterium]